MKKILPVLFIAAILFIISSHTLNIRIKEEARKQKLVESLDRPLYLNLEDSSLSITLKEVGVSYSPETDEITIDKEKLNTFFSELEKDYSFIANNTIISFEDYTFRVPSENAQVSIERSLFENQESVAHLLLDSNVKIKVELNTLDTPELQKSKTDQLIEKTTIPLLVKYGRNPVYISPEILQTFIRVEENDGLYLGIIDEAPISDYLNELSEVHSSEDVKIIHPKAVDAIRRALLFRSADYQINNAVILPLEGNPRSNGDLHDVYMEVIKSQQRLYRFEHGELVKTYIISTGLTWETPPGKFSVLGKERMAISYFGNWYMPHYLPLGNVNGSYRFGFHAIPYHMDGNGNIFSRDANTMGSPATGGCIQLTSEEAQELFEWAWIGIPVYIYE